MNKTYTLQKAKYFTEFMNSVLYAADLTVGSKVWYYEKPDELSEEENKKTAVITGIISRNDDPDKYDKLQESDVSFDYGISVEFVTDDDILYVFAKY